MLVCRVAYLKVGELEPSRKNPCILMSEWHSPIAYMQFRMEITTYGMCVWKVVDADISCEMEH